jgi:hypothetical protein
MTPASRPPRAWMMGVTIPTTIVAIAGAPLALAPSLRAAMSEMLLVGSAPGPTNASSR